MEYDRKLIKFQKLRLRRPLEDFVYQLEKLMKLLAKNTTPGRLNSGLLYVRDPGMFNGAWTESQLQEAEELNRQASTCWDQFNILMQKVHSEVPEAFDEPVSFSWSFWTKSND